ncbi:MAG: hypothetical protein E8D45_06880 [Nitrospira sp.]|nr:MAG: hypothetical protein E8D45_06880 [Nitrospira sp.]
MKRFETNPASHDDASERDRFRADANRGLFPSFPPQTAPFSAYDITAGSECELQPAVAGSRRDVDLALTVQASNYFRNVVKRAAAGDSPARAVSDLERFLSRAPNQVWEHSWVRFPRRLLSAFAEQVFDHDLRADKRMPDGPIRWDTDKFLFVSQGETWTRVPVSYLLKLALADAISTGPPLPAELRRLGERLMGHFLNDNSSPETHSFYVVALRPETGMGRAIAKETSKRYLLTQLLVCYANERFGLRRSGQRALVYFSPNPPVRLQQLNDLISDSFYRDLFMNPCLSGWDQGEEKHHYMALCHQVLSRSLLNTLPKLKEAGIITRNLVILPNGSTISLANNGTHLSLGSRTLSNCLRDGSSRFDHRAEKYVGDLAIKIVEHFLPLFVNTFSAAPYRLDFRDFHPERALGFLPHELDYTHLRMLWRRWKKKAGLKIFGQPITPLGPVWMDRFLSAVFGLRGDLVPDRRLIDYLVSLLSTDQSPGLDGTLGNDVRLKKDLAEMGVFDEHMSVYLLYKLRSFAAMGFSGFEGRQYSQFDSLIDDFGDAATLQALVTALAYRYIADRSVAHRDIPDDPSTESERRQVIFATAIGIPTFNVRQNSPNAFMLKILSRAGHTRLSRRYANHWRVKTLEYRRTLLAMLREEGADLVEAYGAAPLLDRLEARINDPDKESVAGKLTRGILDEAGAASWTALSGSEFNLAAESYYRGTLRLRHLREGLDQLEADVTAQERDVEEGAWKPLQSADQRPPSRIVADLKRAVLEERAGEGALRTLIGLTLWSVSADARVCGAEQEQQSHEPVGASVH